MHIFHRLAPLALSVLTACATTNAIEPPPWPWKDAVPSACGSGRCTNPEAQLAFARASNYCRQVMDQQDRKDAMFGGTKLGIGTIGSIAGGVIAQFTQGAGSRAWAGVSGVANGIQTQMDGFFAHAVDLNRRKQIAQAALGGAARVREASSPDAKVERAMEMALACSMNSAVADAALLNLLGPPQVSEEDKFGPSETLAGDELRIILPYAPSDPAAQIDEQALLRAKQTCSRHARALVVNSVKKTYTCAGQNCRLESIYRCPGSK